MFYIFFCHIVSLNTCSDAAESGVVAWDCKYNEEVMLIPYGLFVAGDNPMQAEECSHAGLNCNYFCRTCDVGGTKQHKESAAGYESIFVVGTSLWRLQFNDMYSQACNLRTPEGTAQEIRRQFETVQVRRINKTPEFSVDDWHPRFCFEFDSQHSN
jgi:hypothetical protein